MCVGVCVCVPVYVYVCVFDLCACSLNVWCRARVYRYECACWTKQSDTRRIFSKIYSGWFPRLKNNQIESQDSQGNLQHLAPWAWTGNSTQNHQQQKSKVGKLPTQKLYTGYWGFDGNVLGANRSYFAETLGRFGRAKISQTQKDNSSSKRAKLGNFQLKNCTQDAEILMEMCLRHNDLMLLQFWADSVGPKFKGINFHPTWVAQKPGVEALNVL